MKQDRFFKIYQEEEEQATMLKLKDWPPEAHFSERLPRHNQVLLHPCLSPGLPSTHPLVSSEPSQHITEGAAAAPKTGAAHGCFPPASHSACFHTDSKVLQSGAQA